MAFNYEKNKEHASDSFWTSYSDLFLGLSTIFLLLYVTASLRTGTDAIKNEVENQQLTMQVEELKNQLKMYESVKNDYLEKSAPKDEMQEYQELMDKLTLLQEDAKSEKDKLVQEALENDKKAKALNKYQQMVRNIIDANKVAKAKIIKRDDMIQQQDLEIDTQQKQITDLNKDISSKKQLIAMGEKKIADTQASLNKSMKELQHAYKQNKISKKSFEQKTAQLKSENQKKISALNNANQQYEQQLNQASQQLSRVTGQLAQTQNALSQKENEAQSLQKQLAASSVEAAGLKGKISSLKSGYAVEKARDKAAFDAALSKEKWGAAEKARREAQFRAGAEAKERVLRSQLGALEGQLKDTEGALAKAKTEIDARRTIAQEISKGFAKAGVKADIDMQTGEVVLDFGNNYFDSDSANLKPEMKTVLEKAMPSYTKSLFGNPKIAKMISAVEIVGFASPTYRGRFIDPNSPNPDDKAAIKYNMDLSYRRANAIFTHLLEDKDIRFEHQKDLLSLMKVSGRSFLEVMKIQNRNVANSAEFCKVNDCKKAQRVIVRFSMDKK